MIGMNQIKKRLLNGILIGLSIGIVLVIVTILIASSIVKGYEEGTNKKFLANYTDMVVTFNRDVIQGEKITADIIATTRVHRSTLPADAANSGSVVGRIAKYNIPRNITLVNSMFTDSIISVDVRVQEISSILLPTNVAINEYVDIRIMYPSGIEYIVLAQKQIKNIVGQTIWLDLTEEELLILNSAMVDSYMTEGSKLYAVQYTDPTTQIKFSENEMDLAKLYIKEKIVEELNSVIKTAKVEETASDKKDLTTEKTEEVKKEEKISQEVEKVIETSNLEEVLTENKEQLLVTTEETENPKLVIDSGTLEVDNLIGLVTKYAIEYRYYVESYNKIETNYQPNTHIIAFMKSNKYIVDQAKEKLSQTIRESIEANVISFEDKVGESFTTIVSGIQNSISTQQSLRDMLTQQQQQQ